MYIFLSHKGSLTIVQAQFVMDFALGSRIGEVTDVALVSFPPAILILLFSETVLPWI